MTSTYMTKTRTCQVEQPVHCFCQLADSPTDNEPGSTHTQQPDQLRQASCRACLQKQATQRCLETDFLYADTSVLSMSSPACKHSC